MKISLPEIQDGLYSRQIYFPNAVEYLVAKTLRQKYKVYPTEHYFTKAKKLNINPNTYKALLYGDIIEAEISNSEVTKIIVRLPNRYDTSTDICGALAFNKNENDVFVSVKTVWLNNRFDNHNTIRTEKYVKM